MFDQHHGCAGASPQYLEGQGVILAILSKSVHSAFPITKDELAHAIADLIDVPLTWNNVEASMERLRGAAHVLVRLVDVKGLCSGDWEQTVNAQALQQGGR